MKRSVTIGAGAALALSMAVGIARVPEAVADTAAPAPAPMAPAPMAPAPPPTVDPSAPYIPPAAPPPVYVDLPNGEAAEVNGEPIMLADVNRLLDHVAAMNPTLSTGDDAAKKALASLRGRILDDMVTVKLLDQEGERLKLIPNAADIDVSVKQIRDHFKTDKEYVDALAKEHVTPDYVRKNIGEQLQAEAVRKQWVSDIVVPDDEVQKFYADPQNQKPMMMPETVKARHILLLVDAKATPEQQEKIRLHAEGVLKLALKGQDFGKLAEQFSQDPGSKGGGGELGFFSQEQMIPEFSEAAFKSPPGVINHLVKTSYGYHIIKVEEKQPPHVAPYDEVKDNIKSYLLQQKTEERYSQRLSALRQTATVKEDTKLKDDPRPAPGTKGP